MGKRRKCTFFPSLSKFLNLSRFDILVRIRVILMDHDRHATILEGVLFEYPKLVEVPLYCQHCSFGRNPPKMLRWWAITIWRRRESFPISR